MNVRPWLLSAAVLAVLTFALWSDLRLQISFGQGSWDFLTFSSAPTLTPKWDLLTFSGFVNAAGSTATTPTSKTPVASNNAPVPPVKAGQLPYTPATNVFPTVDKSKATKTTIVALLDTTDAKSMQDQLIPKEGTKSPTGMTFSLDTFEQQKDWARTITADPAWQSRWEDITMTTYHPCCGVTIATNDCGHAIALTGLVKKLLQDGKSDQEIKTELMLWEKYFFPRHYVIMALALKKAGQPLDKIDLSPNYSTVQSEQFATDYLVY